MTQTSTSSRPALVVAGMHRSGTSAMARVLSLAGASLPERVIQPGPDNPLGFWEPWEMVALSDDILTTVGSAWDDIFVHRADARAWAERDAFLDRAQAFIAQNYADRPLPVLKDPRASVLSRLWRQALENQGLSPVYVVMVRHPLEVAGSLHARDGFPIEKGLLVWAAYMLAAERDTRGQARVFVAYDDLLEDWRGVLDRVDRALGSALPGRAAAEAEIDAFLSRSHRHHEADARDPAEIGGPVVGAIHTWMRAAAAGAEPGPADMDDTARAMEAQATLWGPVLDDQQRRAAQRIGAFEIEIADGQARLLRERARVAEIVAAEAARRDALALAVQAASDRAEASETAAADSEAALRALRLEAIELKTTVSALLDERAVLRDERASAEAAAVTLGEEILDRDLRLAQLAEDVRTLEHRVGTLRSSVSWKITRPVRVIQTRLKRRPAAAP